MTKVIKLYMMKPMDICLYSFAVAVSRTFWVMVTTSLGFKGLGMHFTTSLSSALIALTLIHLFKLYKLRKDAK